MATKPSAISAKRRPEDTSKARSRRQIPRYRVRTRGEPPADLPDRVSRAHAQAVLLLRKTPAAADEGRISAKDLPL